MMSIPFFGAFVALLLAVLRFRTGAVLVSLLSAVAALVLFGLHMTDPIAIDL